MEIKSLRTLALNARDLTRGEKFYAGILRGRVVRRIEPTEEQLRGERVKEVDIQLGNFQIHIFDASKGTRSGVPHHTLNISWEKKEVAIMNFLSL